MRHLINVMEEASDTSTVWPFLSSFSATCSWRGAQFMSGHEVKLAVCENRGMNRRRQHEARAAAANRPAVLPVIISSSLVVGSWTSCIAHVKTYEKERRNK